MRRTKEDAEQTRLNILTSAMNIFYEKGYSKTTFDEIAKRINLTKGAVYWYFRNKPDIVAALINENAKKYIAEQRKIIPEGKVVDFDDIINMHLYTNKRICSDVNFYKFTFFVFCQMEWSEIVLTKIRPLIEETKKFSRSFVYDSLLQMQKDGKIKKDVDIHIITDILSCTYTGIIESFMTKRVNSDVDDLVKESFNFIFYSIKEENKQ